MGYQDVQRFLDKQHDDGARAGEEATRKEAALRTALVKRGWPEDKVSFGPWERTGDRMHGSVTLAWQGEAHADAGDRLSLDLRLAIGGDSTWLDTKDGSPFLTTATKTQEDVVAEWLEAHVKTHIRIRFAGTSAR